MHLVIKMVHDGYRRYFIFKIRMIVSIGMILLEINVALIRVQIASQLLDFFIHVLFELFTTDLLCTAINDQASQDVTAFLSLCICLLPLIF